MANETPLPHFNGPEPLNPPRAEPPETPRAVDELYFWLKRQLGNNALMLLLLCFVVTLVAWRGQEKLEDVSDQRLQPVRRQVDEHEQKLRHHEEDLHQSELDFRELYRVMPVIRRSDRLEHPWPGHDGGAP